MVLIPTRVPSGNGDYYTTYMPAPANGNGNGNGRNGSNGNGNGNGYTSNGNGNGLEKPSKQRGKTDGYGLPVAKSPWQGMYTDGAFVSLSESVSFTCVSVYAN